MDTYTGIILADNDPKGLGRYKVHIPSLFASEREQIGIWCTSKIAGSTYQRYKQTGDNKVSSVGQYNPLKAGMMVEVRLTDHHRGIITTLVDTTATPNKERDSFSVTHKTENDTWDYYDENLELYHKMITNGISNIMMDQKYFHVNIGHLKTLDGKGIEQKTGTVLKIWDKGITIHQNDSFIRMDNDVVELRASATTYIRMTKDTMEIFSPNIKISADKKLDVHSRDQINITAKNNLHVTSDNVSIQGYKCLTTDTTHHYAKSAYHNTITNGYSVKANAIKLNASATTITGTVGIGGSLGIAGLTGTAGGIVTPFIGAASGTKKPVPSGAPASASLASATVSGGSAGVAGAGSVAGSNPKTTAKDATDIVDKSTNMPWGDIDYISERVKFINNYDRINNDKTTYKI